MDLNEAFRDSERAYRSATDSSVAGTSYQAVENDSTSRIVGSSRPQDIGNFIRANGLTSDRIEPGRNYFIPSSSYAYGVQDDIGQLALNIGNARLDAIEKGSAAHAATNSDGFNDGLDVRDIRDSFAYKSGLSRGLQNAAIEASVTTRIALGSSASQWDGVSGKLPPELSVGDRARMSSFGMQAGHSLAISSLVPADVLKSTFSSGFNGMTNLIDGDYAGAAWNAGELALIVAPLGASKTAGIFRSESAALNAELNTAIRAGFNSASPPAVAFDPVSRPDILGSPFERIVSQVPGRVISRSSALTPGALGDTLDSVAATFSGGRYATVELSDDLVLHRAWTPGSSREFGGFWSMERPAGSLQTRIDAALLPEWGKHSRDKLPRAGDRIHYHKNTCWHDRACRRNWWARWQLGGRRQSVID